MGRKKGDSLGGGSTLTDWHRQKRKRELQKNKEQRVAARDAKVKETKTSREIQHDIQQLERQYKVKEGGNPRPHHIQSKLDRLKKELKLVQQHEQDTKSPKDASSSFLKQQQQQAAQWKPMDHPQLSVYYDKVLNPFGEPPPGKPRLFHTPNGGTTMDWRQAGLPGHPTIGQLQHQQQQERERQAEQNRGRVKGNSKVDRSSNSHADRSESNRHKKDSSKDGDSSVGNRRPSEDPKATTNTESTPIPPKRQAAAQTESSGLAASRPKRYGNKQVTDIWALDQDEEESALPPLEEDDAAETSSFSKNKKKKAPKSKQSSPPLLPPPDDCWFYRDQAENVQGPFTTDQMRQWVAAGFFPPHQQVRASNATFFQPLQESLLWSNPSLSNPESSTNTSGDTSSSSVQDRIAALKQERAVETSDNLNEDKTASPNSIHARIAALKQAHTATETNPNPTSPVENDETVPEMDSVQARIAALKQARAAEESNELADEPTKDDDTLSLPKDSVQSRIAALKAAAMEEQRPTEDSVESRIAALKAERTQQMSKESNAPLPAPEMADVAYPVDNMADVAYPVPDGGDMADVAYPVPDGGDMADVAYPVSEGGDMADVGYPVNDDDNAYPTGNDGEPGYPSEYPVGEAYPSGEDEAGDYPVVDSYPVVDTYPLDDGETAAEVEIPVKKKAKVDKEVISMLPSHLRRKS